MNERHCVVLAGGLGTRISAVTKDLIPKALVNVLGRPFLDFKILSLKRMGVTHIWILVGAHGEQIEHYVNDLPFLNLNIRVVHDGPTLLGTAGSIARISDQLPERFWVTYADTYVIADLDQAERCWDTLNLRIMCVLKNQDQYETSNVSIANDRVSVYNKRARPGNHKWIDYGLLRLFKDDFKDLPNNKATDLQEVLSPLVSKGLLGGWQVKEQFWDVGTPQSIVKTETNFSSMRWDEMW